MKYFNYLLVISAILLMTACSKKPDTVFVNGKFYTMDGENTIVEAIAVKDHKIINLGTSQQLKDEYKDVNTIDLQGKTVVPGFIDMEGSLFAYADRLNISVADLSQTGNIKDMVQMLKAYSEGKSNDVWIIGMNFDENNFQEKELDSFNKSILDVVSENHNVFIMNKNKDMVLCNSKLLNTLAITNQTPDPKDGEIIKDDKNMLTGILLGSAINLIKEKEPQTDYRRTIENVTKELTKFGITEVHDKTINNKSIELFKEMIDSNKFHLKIFGVLSAEDPDFDENIKRGIEVNYKDLLTLRTVSIDYDGALNIKAASMKDNYLTEKDNSYPYANNEQVENSLRKAIDKKFQFSIKTVGDNAVYNNLNTIEKVIKERGIKDHRTILEYVEFVQPADMKRMSELGIIPSIRPEITVNDLQIADKLLPSQNIQNLGQWNSLLHNCKTITAGSNFPFNYSGPIFLIYIMTNRTPLDTLVTDMPGQNQKLSVLEAVKSLTVYAAYAGFEEDTKGTLEKNKYADFVVLSEDIFNYDISKINQIEVLKTIINGNIVYSK